LILGFIVWLTIVFCKWGESAAFIRSDNPVLFPKSEYPEVLPDSTAGLNSPDLELYTTPMAYKVAISCHFSSFHIAEVPIFKDHGFVLFDVHTYALHVYLLKYDIRSMK